MPHPNPPRTVMFTCYYPCHHIHLCLCPDHTLLPLRTSLLCHMYIQSPCQPLPGMHALLLDLALMPAVGMITAQCSPRGLPLDPASILLYRQEPASGECPDLGALTPRFYHSPVCPEGGMITEAVLQECSPPSPMLLIERNECASVR